MKIYSGRTELLEHNYWRYSTCNWHVNDMEKNSLTDEGLKLCRQEAQLESSLGKKFKLSIMLTDHVQGKERYTQGIEDFVRNFVVMHCKSFKATIF